MKLIVGLGNPGKKYQDTRHNVGYLVIDKIAKSLKLKAKNLGSKFLSEICILDNKIILAKPLTFMNEAGRAVKKIINFYKIPLKNLIVISDDIDMELGKVRERLEGSSGGHKGLQSIIDELGADKFKRIKIGIGRSKKIPAEKWVLGKFTNKEKEVINKAVEEVFEIIKIPLEDYII